MNNNNNKKSPPDNSRSTSTGRSASRGAAIRAQKRNQEDAQRIANQYAAAP